MSPDKRNGAWGTREKILMFSGLTVIGLLVIAVEFLGRPFHFEFILAGLALCGVAITQAGDKK